MAETRLAVAPDVDGSPPVAAQQRTLDLWLLGSYSCRDLSPDGGLWQEFNPGLPDIPITDVIPEHDELAMASHGRGFWAFDNIAALRQLEPGTTDRDLVLFDPAVPYRSANGVVLSWWLGEEAVRTMSPAVPPGTYAVRLTVGERVETTEVEVRRNPWIEDVTEEDLVAQYEFGMRIRDQVHAANSAVIAIREVEAELAERLEAVDDETLAEAAERLRTAMDEVEGEIFQGAEPVEPGPTELPHQGDQSPVGIRGRNEGVDRTPVIRRHGARCNNWVPRDFGTVTTTPCQPPSRSRIVLLALNHDDTYNGPPPNNWRDRT